MVLYNEELTGQQGAELGQRNPRSYGVLGLKL
jgi:hypothetical protein